MKTTFNLGLAVIIGILQLTCATDTQNQDVAAYDTDYAFAEPSTDTLINQDTYDPAADNILPRKKCRDNSSQNNAYVPNAAYDVFPTESPIPTPELIAHDTYESIPSNPSTTTSASTSDYTSATLEMPYVEDISTSNARIAFGQASLISILGGIGLSAIL